MEVGVGAVSGKGSPKLDANSGVLGRAQAIKYVVDHVCLFNSSLRLLSVA